MSYIKKAIRGIGIVFVMNIIAYTVAYLTRLVLARSLGPKDYGLFYAVFTFVIFFLFFRDLGLNVALRKYIPEFKVFNKVKEINTAIITTLLLQLLGSGIFMILLYALSPYLTIYYFKDPAALPILHVMIFYTLCSISFTLFKELFSGFQDFKWFSSIDTTKNTIVFILIIVFLHFGLGPLSPAWAYVLAGIALWLIYLWPVLKLHKPSFSLEGIRPMSGLLLTFGIPVILTDIGDKVISYIDTLMLTYFRSLAEVGIYNVVLPTAMTLLFIASSTVPIIYPIVSELWARKEVAKLKEGIKLMHKYLFLAAIPLILAVATFASPFLRFFFGQEYISGTIAFQILLIGVLFFIVAAVNHAVISAIGYPKIVTKIIFAAAAVNAGSNLFLIPRFGIEGAAVATFLSYLLALILSTIYLKKLMNAEIPLLLWLKTAFVAIVFTSISLLTQLLNLPLIAKLPLALTLATIGYIAAAYLLDLFHPSEIKRYIALVR